MFGVPKNTFFLGFKQHPNWKMLVYIGCGPLPVTVTTRNITFLVGDPYKPSFTTATGRGPHPRYIYISIHIHRSIRVISVDFFKNNLKELPGVSHPKKERKRKEDRLPSIPCFRCKGCYMSCREGEHVWTFF